MDGPRENLPSAMLRDAKVCDSLVSQLHQIRCSFESEHARQGALAIVTALDKVTKLSLTLAENLREKAAEA